MLDLTRVHDNLNDTGAQPQALLMDDTNESDLEMLQMAEEALSKQEERKQGFIYEHQDSERGFTTESNERREDLKLRK